MLQKYGSIEELWNAIEMDASTRHPSYTRYPVRFIFINSFNSLKKICQDFAFKKTTIKPLKDMLTSEDGWLTPDEISAYIKQQEQSVLVIPLSEILRFFSSGDFNTLLSALLEIENGCTGLIKRRIYIPMVGIRERFEKDFWNTYHRKNSGIPIWYLDDTCLSKTKIIQLMFKTEFIVPKTYTKCYTVENSFDWLDFWKQETPAIIISKSKVLSCIYKDFLPDAVFTLQEVHHLKEYISILTDSEFTIDYVASEAPFWEKLIHQAIALADANEKLNINKLICYHLNIQNLFEYSDTDIIRLWFNNKKTYSRWLLKNWFVNQNKYKESYLYTTMSNITTYSDDELINHIWFKIFETAETNHQATFSQRKKYLEIIHKELQIPVFQFEEKIKNKLELITNQSFESLADYLTSITFYEKKLAIQAFINASDNHTKKPYQILHSLYPELAHYMAWRTALINEKCDDWVCDYLQEYSYSKVHHCKTAKLSNRLEVINKDQNSFFQWFYKVPNIHTLIDDNKGACIWIDALGAEWIPFFRYCIDTYGKDKKRYIKELNLCRVNLPSTTECNRFDNFKCVSDLDEYIHHEKPYKHPDDLIKQIKLIKKIIIEHVIENPHDTVSVVSDHGFSFLCQKEFGNSKKYNFSASDHEGRCMWVKRSIPNDDEFMAIEVDNGPCKGKRSMVALKHTSLFNTPSREVHGGATPEEVLVPYIVVSRKSEDVLFQLTDYTKQITIQNPNLLVEIDPKPNIPPLLKSKEEIICQLVYKSGKWEGKLPGFKAGRYIFELHVETQKFSLRIEIKGGIVERELF